MSVARDLRSLDRDLDVLLAEPLPQPGVLRPLVDRLASALNAGVIAHRPELTPNGWAAEQMVVSDDPKMRHVAQLTEAFLPRAPLAYAHFNPLRVQPDQQNRLLPDAELRAVCDSSAPPAVFEAVYIPGGVANLSHTRIILADGAFMLSWLGFWREEPFSAGDTLSIMRVAPAVAARLSVERILWAGAPGSFEALGQALELVGRAAFVVNPAGQLAFVNELGRWALDRDRSVVADITDAALRGVTSPRVHSVTPIRGAGAQTHFIVLTSDSRPAIGIRLRAFARERKLTPTEARVLAHLINGDANKDMAAKEGCAVRTIEVHVTTLLRKCVADSRARLIARFWASES